MSRQVGTGNKASVYVGARDWLYFSRLSKAALLDLVISAAREKRGRALSWLESAEYSSGVVVARNDRPPTFPAWWERQVGAQ